MGTPPSTCRRRRAPTLLAGITAMAMVAVATRQRTVGATAKAPAPDWNGLSLPVSATPIATAAPAARVSENEALMGGEGKKEGRVGDHAWLHSSSLIFEAKLRSLISKEESLLRLRAPTCLDLPTHGALSQFGFFVWVLLRCNCVHTLLVSYSSRVIAVLSDLA